MDQRAAFRDTLALARARNMPRHEGTEDGLAHLESMHERITGDFSDAKLGRWLGWAQKTLQVEAAMTLEEIKQVNLYRSGRRDPARGDLLSYRTADGRPCLGYCLAVDERHAVVRDPGPTGAVLTVSRDRTAVLDPALCSHPFDGSPDSVEAFSQWFAGRPLRLPPVRSGNHRRSLPLPSGQLAPPGAMVHLALSGRFVTTWVD